MSIVNRSKLLFRRDFLYNEEGKMVLTRRYHLRRGSCCGSDCLHCPYDGVKGSKIVKK